MSPQRKGGCFRRSNGSYSEAFSGAEKQTVDIGKVSVILMGVLFLVSGNFMTKTRINGTVGVRIGWSMYNEIIHGEKVIVSVRLP